MIYWIWVWLGFWFWFGLFTKVAGSCCSPNILFQIQTVAERYRSQPFRSNITPQLSTFNTHSLTHWSDDPFQTSLHRTWAISTAVANCFPHLYSYSNNPSFPPSLHSPFASTPLSNAGLSTLSTSILYFSQPQNSNNSKQTQTTFNTSFTQTSTALIYTLTSLTTCIRMKPVHERQGTAHRSTYIGGNRQLSSWVKEGPHSLTWGRNLMDPWEQARVCHHQEVYHHQGCISQATYPPNSHHLMHLQRRAVC